MEEYSDIDLIHLIKKESTPAFHELYKRYWKSLYRMARQKMKNEQDACDLVQEVFVSIWQKRDTLHIRESVAGYLFTILKFEIYDFYTRTARLETQQLAMLPETVVIANTTTDEIAFNELSGIINQEVERLPERMQEIFRLSKEKEMAADEIAQQMSISVQTVRNQLSTSLKKLKFSLSRHYAENS